MNILDFKKNEHFEWIFWILRKWIFVLNKYSRLFKKWIFVWNEWFWTNELIFRTYILVLVRPRQKCSLKIFQTHLKSFRNHLLGPFQFISGVLDPYRGLWRAPKLYFGLLLEFLIIFLKFFWMNNSIEYSILYWMNILDFVLNWIIFRPDSMKKWFFKTDRPGLPLGPCRTTPWPLGTL